MSTRTTYYNLTKPDADEHVLRTVINQNYDAIDLQMHANAQAAQEAAEISADEYDTTATYNPGDFCIYQNTLYKCNATTTGDFDPTKWTATTIAQAFEPKHTWTLLETITADGTQYRYIRDLPKGTSGIFIICYFKETTQAATHFRGQISFDNGATYINMIYMASAITSGDRYGRGSIIKDGNLWQGESIISVTDGGDIQVRALTNGYIITSAEITNVLIRTSAGSGYFESGSTFDIYIRQ